MDNTNKFTGKSSAYASSRPKYAEQFIQYLKNSAGLGLESIVADIGSGTGILSSQLLDIGCTVIAVEPNDDMRNTAEKLLGGNERFNSVKGSAENTALEDYSVNYITVGQAFHWFDHKKFKAECKRILKPGGKVILVWNSRVSSNKMIKEIYKKNGMRPITGCRRPVTPVIDRLPGGNPASCLFLSGR